MRKYREPEREWMENMTKLNDLTGKRFGEITVIERADDYISPSGNKATRWKCKCDCGNEFIVKSSRLTSGRVASCGCNELENLISETIGKKFGKLTCMEYSHKEYGVGHFFKFKCDCGNEIIRNISRVRTGKINSCGCLRKENAREAVFQDLTGKRFNYLTVIEYIGRNNGRTMWKCKCDCGNEVNVDSNSLKSGNTTACGCRKQTLTMWAREYGLKPRIVSSRLKYGWNFEDALNIPVGEVGNYETYNSRNGK